MKILPIALAATFTVPIINDSGYTLEPSVINEVEHALDRAPTNPPPLNVSYDIFGTNGLSASDIAIKLVSCQDSDGCWKVNSTNATSEAIKILSLLLEPSIPKHPAVFHNPKDANLTKRGVRSNRHKK